MVKDFFSFTELKAIKLTPHQAKNWNPDKIRALLDGNTAVKPVEFTSTNSDIKTSQEIDQLKKDFHEIKEFYAKFQEIYNKQNEEITVLQCRLL